MTVEIHPIVHIRKIRQSLHEKIASYERRGNAAKYLALLNTPLSLPELNKRERCVTGRQTTAGRSRQQTIEGVLGYGKSTKYSIDGQDFHIDDATWVFGALEIGRRVCMKYNTYFSSAPKAQSVRVKSELQ